MSVKQNQLYIYLEDFEADALVDQLEELYQNIGFSEEEAKLEHIESAMRLAIEMTSKQGGKINLVIGNSAEYLPKIQEADKTKRGYFYSSDHNFSRLAADMHRYFTSVDLYLFGHRKNKNLGSLAEFIRLSGGDICYYDSAESNERSLKSGPVLQRPHLQPLQAEVLGDCVPHQVFQRLEEVVLRQFLRKHFQRPA